MTGAPGPTERRGHWIAAFAGSVVLHAAGMAYAFDLFPDIREEQAATPSSTVVTITEARVETVPDTAALPGPQPDTPVDENPAPDRTAAVQTVEPAAPEAPTPPGRDPEATSDPETLTGASPVAQSLRPIVVPDPNAPGTPVAPIPDALSPTAPTEATPGTVTATMPTVTAPDPSESPTLTSTLPQAPPAEPRPAPPSDPVLLELVDRIRASLDDACLIALPQPQGPALPPLVTTLTDQDVTHRRFAEATLSDPDLPVEIEALLVDRRQCPTLTFLRARPNYPAFGLSLGLSQTSLASGETLTGTIEGTTGRFASLLLVDDNGVVQDLGRFLRFTGGRAEFAVPVTRDGPARDTAILLVALATPTRPEAIGRLSGRLAEEVFPALARQVGASAAVTVQPLAVN